MAAKQLAESFLNIVKGPRSVGPFPSGTSRLPLDLLSTMNKLARIPGQRAPRSVYDTRIHPIRLLALGPLNETPQDVPSDVLALVNELDTEFRAFNNADVYESVVKESPFFAQNNISVPKESDPEYAVDWDKLEATATDKHSFNLAKEVSQTVREAVRIIENDHRLCPYELEAETILGELYERHVKPLVPSADSFSAIFADYEYLNFYHENIATLSAAEVLAREPKAALFLQDQMDNNQWFVESIDDEDEM